MQDLKIVCAEVFHSQKIVAMINDNQRCSSDKGRKNGFVSLRTEVIQNSSKRAAAAGGRLLRAGFSFVLCKWMGVF